MISLNHVSKSYDSQRVLDDFSLKISQGEHIALMGRSGAGKTTVMRLFLQLTKPDSGSLSLSEEVKMGVVFQEDRLIEALSAVGNVCVMHDKAFPADRAISLLQSLGLNHELLHKPVSQLSGGEKRRVAIARALSMDADLYILDEPFKGIDETTLSLVCDTVASAASGKAILLITHSLSEAQALACRIVEIG